MCGKTLHENLQSQGSHMYHRFKLLFVALYLTNLGTTPFPQNSFGLRNINIVDLVKLKLNNYCLYMSIVRTVLMALIGFMPTQGAGAIGSLDYTPQERKVLAKK